MTFLDHTQHQFEIGKAYHLLFSDEPTLCHFLAIVDEDQIVYKFWNKYKKWWVYKVNSTLSINFYYNAFLSEKKK